MEAFGKPGIEPRWTSTEKSSVGTALSAASDLWFTLAHGIVNEVYHPRPDTANIRDFGLLVADGQGFVSEEKRHTDTEVTYPAGGVPLVELTNTCRQGRYRIVKTVFSMPDRPVLYVQVGFEPLEGSLGDYTIYALLSPHLENFGWGNDAWVGDFKGEAGLFAARGETAVALMSSAGWTRRSAGYVGYSDGWQDLMQHGRLDWQFGRAEDGNVALVGGVDPEAAGGAFDFALGLGRSAEEAGHHARAALAAEAAECRQAYVDGWREWHRGLWQPSQSVDGWHESLAVMRVHQDKTVPGGVVASLSVPWGRSKGDEDLGGYHLVWVRDMVEVGGGFLAAGAGREVRRIIRYLQATQSGDGSWTQNMWLEGKPYWTGVQMDEVALPILLVDHARREGLFSGGQLARCWPMVRRAAGYIARNGPVTPQDRWEEEAGYTPFTLAAEIAALVVAADLADRLEVDADADYLRQTADIWNANLERWLYVEESRLARRLELEGFYVRLTPPDVSEASTPLQGYVPVKSRPFDEATGPAEDVISTDALALVRFGLRSPHDPRIERTVEAIDAMLRVSTPVGPAWRRYNGDAYGEYDDGRPFDGSGVGRAWPLLTGERAHFELARGHEARARQLRETMGAFRNDGGMLPEQVWDAEPIPDRGLYPGEATGAANPLTWAHAEYVQLIRSLEAGRVFDTPPQTVARYLEAEPPEPRAFWRFNHKIRTVPDGSPLRVEVLDPAVVRWGRGGWEEPREIETRATGLGVHYADLPVEELSVGEVVAFTFYWRDQQRWEQRDFYVEVVPSEVFASGSSTDG